MLVIYGYDGLFVGSILSNRGEPIPLEVCLELVSCHQIVLMEVLLLELSMDFLGSLAPLVLLQVGWYLKFLSMFQGDPTIVVYNFWPNWTLK